MLDNMYAFIEKTFPFFEDLDYTVKVEIVNHTLIQATCHNVRAGIAITAITYGLLTGPKSKPLLSPWQVAHISP